MKIAQLKYFIAAAEYKNITTASKKLHIAQPPLSRQISMLEEEMGVTLLNRSNRGIELTKAGKVLYDKAKVIMKAIDEMNEIVKETDTGLCGEINIGSIYSTIAVFSSQIRYISQTYPTIKFRIFHGTPNELIDWLEEGIVDMIFLRSPTCETRDFHYHILTEDDLVLVTHGDLDPDPDSPELEIEQLKDVPLCMLRSGKYWGYNEFLVNECTKHGFTPNIICQCQDTSVALALVMEKVGISYQPRQSVEMLNHPDIYIKPIRNFEIKTYPTLIWNDDAHLSRSVKLFLSLFNVKSSQNYESLDDLLAKFERD